MTTKTTQIAREYAVKCYRDTYQKLGYPRGFGNTALFKEICTMIRNGDLDSDDIVSGWISEYLSEPVTPSAPIVTETCRPIWSNSQYAAVYSASLAVPEYEDLTGRHRCASLPKLKGYFGHRNATVSSCLGRDDSQDAVATQPMIRTLFLKIVNAGR